MLNMALHRVYAFNVGKGKTCKNFAFGSKDATNALCAVGTYLSNNSSNSKSVYSSVLAGIGDFSVE